MAESAFSWLKVASFIGALVLVLTAVMVFAGGIYLIGDGHAVNGVACFIGSVVCAACAVFVYRNYQKSRYYR